MGMLFQYHCYCMKTVISVLVFLILSVKVQLKLLLQRHICCVNNMSQVLLSEKDPKPKDRNVYFLVSWWCPLFLHQFVSASVSQSNCCFVVTSLLYHRQTVTLTNCKTAICYTTKEPQTLNFFQVSKLFFPNSHKGQQWAFHTQKQTSAGDTKLTFTLYQTCFQMRKRLKGWRVTGWFSKCTFG